MIKISDNQHFQPYYSNPHAISYQKMYVLCNSPPKNFLYKQYNKKCNTQSQVVSFSRAYKIIQGSSINHMVKILGIFDPPPSTWSLLLNNVYVMKWSFGYTSPPQLFTWFMNDPLWLIKCKSLYISYEKLRDRKFV